MYLTRSEYDRGVNTFSPEGRLFQVSIVIINDELCVNNNKKRFVCVSFRFNNPCEKRLTFVCVTNLSTIILHIQLFG